MARQYWLVKSEPDAFSWDMQVANGVEPWTGVRNFTARNNLKAMKIADWAFFYHSNEGKEIVGVVEVVREAYPDPTAEKGDWVCVDMKAVGPMPKPVTLVAIKADPKLIPPNLDPNSIGDPNGVVGPPSDGMRSKHSRDPLKQTLGQGVPAVQVARGSGTQMRPGGQPWPALHETMASLSPASIAALDPSASVAAPFDPRHPERRTIAQPSASRTIGQLVMTPTWVRQKSIGYSTSVDAAT